MLKQKVKAIIDLQGQKRSPLDWLATASITLYFVGFSHLICPAEFNNLVWKAFDTLRKIFYDVLH